MSDLSVWFALAKPLVVGFPFGNFVVKGVLKECGGYGIPSVFMFEIGMPNDGLLAQIVDDVSSAEVVNADFVYAVLIREIFEALEILAPVNIGIGDIFVAVF